MNIADGNIFEAMRLVLPEHRELMGELGRLTRNRKRPELADDEVAEFEYLWGEAWMGQCVLEVTLFQSGDEHTICGIPLSYQPPLRLQTEHGCIMIALQDIIHVKRL